MEALNEIRCSSCAGELVVGRCAEIKLQTDDNVRTLKSWWICSARCAYFLGLKHATLLIEMESRSRADERRRRPRGAIRRIRGGRS
jgi:uncharacterized protein with PIN domain